MQPEPLSPQSTSSSRSSVPPPAPAPSALDGAHGQPGGPGNGDALALPLAPNVRSGTLVAIGAVGLSALLGLFLIGYLPKMHRRQALGAEAESAGTALPRVNATKPKKKASGSDLVLPASVQALQETTVFARTSGYVKRRLVDIGDRVEQGQLLLELETPDLHQELLQAQASLAQARASLEQANTNREFARVSFERYKAMAPQGIASQQDLEEKQAAFNAADAGGHAAEAAINSQQASVRRLTELQSFARVTAPFAGTVTSRTVEVGALVTAGNGSGQALFKVAQVDPIRVIVNVPQAYAPLTQVGQAVQISIRQYPGRTFTGKITRTTGALDPVSRTMLSEVQVPNEDRTLLPGMYAQAKLAVSQVESPLLVPTSALLLGADGTQVAVVDSENHIRMHKVVIDGDYGSEIGVSSGLSSEDLVVTNPGERLSEGAAVTVTVPPPAASGAPK